MQDIIAQSMTYLWGIWRHRWLALVLAWIVALAGWSIVWNMPESYVATAKVYVDTNTVLRPLLKGLAITPDINQRVRMMSGTLLSRPNLEELTRMTDLDLTARTEREKEDLIDRLFESISLKGQRGNTSLYNIEVQDEDRNTARRIAQSLITVFIESSLTEKRDDSSGAQDFIDEQIGEYERRLVDAEARLARFKQKNVDVLPSSLGADYYTRLEQVREELRSSELALSEAIKRRDALSSQVAGARSADSLAAAGITTPTDVRVQQLRLRLDDLLSRYTERHPEVRQLQSLMAELEDQRDMELTVLSQGGAAPAGSSEALMELQLVLTNASASVAELEVRVEEYRGREQDLVSKVTQIPEIEAQLKQLDRDYEVVKSQHEELLGRRESARLSQGIENTASDVTFRVIDPPFVPLSPSEPNKTLLNAAVLLLAIGIGGGIAMLWSMLNPIVVDARMLSETTGLPMLGVVTWNKDASQRRRGRLSVLAFTACSVALLGTYAGIALVPLFVGGAIQI